jgi:hypothetical protein
LYSRYARTKQVELRGVVMTPECEIRVTPADTARLDEILASAPDGAVVCFEPGKYRYYFFPEKSVTFRGVGPGVVFRGDGSSNISVARPIHVVVENVTLTLGDGGAGGAGGNIDVSDNDATVIIRDSTLTRGESMANGGGAVRASGRITLERCVVTDCRGRNADAILASGFGVVTISNSVIRGSGGDVPLLRSAPFDRSLANRRP